MKVANFEMRQLAFEVLRSQGDDGADDAAKFYAENPTVVTAIVLAWAKAEGLNGGALPDDPKRGQLGDMELNLRVKPVGPVFEITGTVLSGSGKNEQTGHATNLSRAYRQMATVLRQWADMLTGVNAPTRN